MEQLWAWQKELEDVRLKLEQEQAELECEIAHRADGGHARAMALDVHRRIIEDDDGVPHFTRASQNIAAVVAMIQGMLEPTMPDERRAHREIRTLLK